MTEETRRAKNAERLLLIDRTIRTQVASVIGTLEHYNYRPLIDREVFRSPAKQLELFRRGVSKVRWGFHCAMRDGKPASLAADIVDCEVGWNAPVEFWLTIGYAAKAQGLGWGGAFGITQGQRGILDALGVEVTKGGRKIGRHEKVPLSWDPAHVQTSRVTVAEAKQGLR